MDQLARRIQLNEEILKPICPNVYFQPDENVQMQYPCIVYGRDNAYKASADNHGYRYVQRYQVTLIDRDPDNPGVEILGRLPNCIPQRSFVTDGLHHDVFELYH